MRLGQTTLQATLTVCITLVAAFVVTGFASRAYHRERTTLGAQHFEQGQRLEAKGDTEAALEQFRKSLFFWPDKTEYRLSLATALLEAGRLNEAESHLEQLLQENPTSGPINLLLGHIALQRGQLKQATEYYQRAVYEYWPESDLPQRRKARWELANLFNRTGNRTGFVAELMQLYTNLPPGDTGQKIKIAELLLTNGATSEAARIFEALAKQIPQNAEVHRGLGQIYFSAGEYVSARHEFQRALRLDSKDVESAQGLALTNDVIEMDAALPAITSSEQMRRSRNLLGRVVKEIESCDGGRGSVQDNALDDARDLLAGKSKQEDAALTMQSVAAQLWVRKAGLCGPAAPSDRALDTVLARLSHE